MSSPGSSPTADTLSTASKRVRTSKPKVRSGCVTCKARRIKCDEAKPFCNRCTKFGRKCGGYKVQLSYEERAAVRHEQSRILPKVHSAMSHHHHQMLPLAPRAPNTTTPPPPNINVPLSPEQIFCIETSLQLCRILESPIWSAMKIEICKQNSFIGHAFSAIRILSKGMPPDDCIDPQIANGGGERLLSFHLERFLQGARASLANGSGSQNTSLAALICLLTVCLDTLQFQHTPALSHIQVGLTLVSQMHHNHHHHASFDNEIVQAFQMLEVKSSLLDPSFPFYLPIPLSLASPFVLPQLICTPEEVAVPIEDLFGFGDDAESYDDSRASSIVGLTP